MFLNISIPGKKKRKKKYTLSILKLNFISKKENIVYKCFCIVLWHDYSLHYDWSQESEIKSTYELMKNLFIGSL